MGRSVPAVGRLVAAGIENASRNDLGNSWDGGRECVIDERFRNAGTRPPRQARPRDGRIPDGRRCRAGTRAARGISRALSRPPRRTGGLPPGPSKPSEHLIEPLRGGGSPRSAQSTQAGQTDGVAQTLTDPDGGVRPVRDPRESTRPKTGTPLRRRSDQPADTTIRYFGDYEVRQVLGRGGMGVVYRARQVSLNRPVALKMIKAGVLADDDELRRFQNEAEAVALLDHPGIVAIYEVGEHEGQRYFSMKLVEGGNLADRLAEIQGQPAGGRRCWPRWPKRCTTPTCAASSTATSSPPTSWSIRGSPPCHRLRPGQAGRGRRRLTHSGAILGTPSYMAPEQAAGRRGIDHHGHRRLRPRRRALCPAGGPAAVRGRQRDRHPGNGPGQPPEPPPQAQRRAYRATWRRSA